MYSISQKTLAIIKRANFICINTEYCFPFPNKSNGIWLHWTIFFLSQTKLKNQKNVSRIIFRSIWAVTGLTLSVCKSPIFQEKSLMPTRCVQHLLSERPRVPPLCRETQSLGQQMLNAPVSIKSGCTQKYGLSCITQIKFGCA